MKNVALVWVVPIVTLAMSVGCSHEVSHSESSHPNWTGGQTNTDKTVMQNPDGSQSVEQSKTVTH